MNLNKCQRCGCFFTSSNHVCPNCMSKDELEINQLKNYLIEYDDNISVEELSISTGISLKNMNRFLENKQVVSEFTQLGLTSKGNINL